MALVAGLLIAVPGLQGVAHTVTRMHKGWIVVAVVLELLSCLGYVLAFLQVFERAPIRFGSAWRCRSWPSTPLFRWAARAAQRSARG